MISDLITEETEDSFTAGGRLFRVVRANYNQHRTSDAEIVILKDPRFLRTYYDAVLPKAPVRNLLEFGVFEGGSIICLALAYPDFKCVGIDLRGPNGSVLRHINDLGLRDRVSIYYNTSQADPSAIARIIATEFKDEPLGIVIDDASHMYDLSRRSFELTFGRLANGGTYCLEDWAWAHWGEPFQTKQWCDLPALTNLLFEAVILCPSVAGLISGIEVFPGVARITRGPTPMQDIKVDRLLRMRSRTLSLI